MFPQSLRLFRFFLLFFFCFQIAYQPIFLHGMQLDTQIKKSCFIRKKYVQKISCFIRKFFVQGEFTIFCGLRDVIVFLENFTITDEDVQYLKSVMPDAEPEFFHYMQSLDPKQMKIRAQKEGSVCFPRVPLITLEGPLALCQLVETTLLTLGWCLNWRRFILIVYLFKCQCKKNLLEVKF